MLHCYSPSFGNNLHTIRVTFMHGEYKGHIAHVIGGNCRGSDLLKADFLEYDTQEDIDQYTENDCKFAFHSDLEIYSAVLKDKNGNTLHMEGDERDFQNHVVSIEFIDVQKDLR